MIDKEEEINEYSNSSKEWSEAEYALNYLEIADQIPYKKDGEMVLLDHIPKTVKKHNLITPWQKSNGYFQF